MCESRELVQPPTSIKKSGMVDPKNMRSRSLKTIGKYQYYQDECLGKGSFSCVYYGYKTINHKPIAMKVVNRHKMNDQLMACLRNEIDTLRRINHPNINHLYDAQRSRNNYYLSLEFCKGGDLSTFMKQYTDGIDNKTTRRFFCDIVDGMKCMWNQNIMHRDLKPQNILLTSNTKDAILKICDLGMVRELEENKLADTICGSPLYMAPEILYKKKYDRRCDLWSLGLILYEMHTGKRLFQANNIIALSRLIDQFDIRIISMSIDIDIYDVLKGLLCVDPNDRMSFSEFFNHPFTQRNMEQSIIHNIDSSIIQSFQKNTRPEIYNITPFMGDMSTFVSVSDSFNIRFPNNVVDFSSLKSHENNRDDIFIQKLQDRMSRAWCIAEYAFLCQKYEQYTNAIVLYERVCTDIDNSIEMCKDYNTCRCDIRKFICLHNWMKTWLRKFMNKGNIILQTTSRFTHVDNFPVPEQLIFRYMIRLCKKLVYINYMSNEQHNKNIFDRCVYLVDYLYDQCPETIGTKEKELLDLYIKQFKCIRKQHYKST